MEINILQTQQGSPDGVTVKTYEEGETCDMPDDLANTFIKEGWAERCGSVKDSGGPPENKDAGHAPENKSQKKRRSGRK